MGGGRGGGRALGERFVIRVVLGLGDGAGDGEEGGVYWIICTIPSQKERSPTIFGSQRGLVDKSPKKKTAPIFLWTDDLDIE